ncbi:MAG: hypothetical protein GC159_02855 [Phycisphaera sp.]|nr:hypothetical protein [Phycisphaera sp.]
MRRATAEPDASGTRPPCPDCGGAFPVTGGIRVLTRQDIDVTEYCPTCGRSTWRGEAVGGPGDTPRVFRAGLIHHASAATPIGLICSQLHPERGNADRLLDWLLGSTMADKPTAPSD